MKEKIPHEMMNHISWCQKHIPKASELDLDDLDAGSELKNKEV